MERVEAVFHYSEVKNKTFGPGFESRIFWIWSIANRHFTVLKVWDTTN